MDISYILNQLGEDRSTYFNAISPPIIQTSNFMFDNVADFKKKIQDEKANHIYTRGNNPTVQILAKKLAALEGAEDALLVASGAAAISNSVIANVKVGDHVVCVNNAYSWANNLLKKLLPRFGVSTTFIEGDKIENFKNAIQENTTVFYLESPSSLLFTLQDLKAVSELAKQHNITTILDNSYASPLSHSPIKQGIDIVLHSATKHIGGHSDVVAGVIASNKAMIEKIFHNEYMTLGNILPPNAAWLLLRGLRTIEIRIKRTSETTQKIIQFLENRSEVSHIFYPFHKSHPQHDLAWQQMRYPMPMFSLLFKTQEEEKIDAFCDALKSFLLAVSWGGHESLALPVSVDKQGETLYLVRFYIGLESPEVLIEDIRQALDVL